MAQDDQFQQKLAATAKARPQSSNPSSRPSSHKFEAIQQRLNRQVSYVDKVLRTDSGKVRDASDRYQQET
jgi:hypothetical protein